ncbi:MAG: plasmid pRiA4b ORF-3 family protein [Candidatus Schekmanbacteria bacterium]|nr:plasmid pRiA4b ORF-3 family protein [Candidatus Schekmanbacteria bacterium]
MKGMQFKITLLDIEPPIWRRIIVPENYSFWDLHVAIQDAFGWFDSHLHSFEINENDDFYIGIPDPEEMDYKEVKAGWETKLKEYIKEIGQKVLYTYDFGDGWEHEIEFEEIIDRETKKPKCTDGARACPPEDCGGTPGYEEFCEIMKRKKGKEYKEMKTWYGKDYDPDEFDASKVKFDNPKTRLKMVYY